MQWADKLDFLAAIEEQRGYTPQALLDRPELDTTERWFMRAFATLSRSRPTGMDACPIPLPHMQSYIETLDSVVEPSEFVEVIQAMDLVWLDRAEKRGGGA